MICEYLTGKKPKHVCDYCKHNVGYSLANPNMIECNKHNRTVDKRNIIMEEEKCVEVIAIQTIK